MDSIVREIVTRSGRRTRSESPTQSIGVGAEDCRTRANCASLRTNIKIVGIGWGLQHDRPPRGIGHRGSRTVCGEHGRPSSMIIRSPHKLSSAVE